MRRKPEAAAGDGCPVKHKNGSVYNVYGVKLDPSNMMPTTAQQLPVPGQAAPMQTNRVVSGIAKGGTEGSWVYPSEQMFYNSLVRKGKGQDVQIDDVPMMISIHNNMNEKTWRQVRFVQNPTLLGTARPVTITSSILGLVFKFGFSKHIRLHGKYSKR